KHLETSVEYRGVTYDVLYQNGIVWFIDPTVNLHARVTSDTEKTVGLTKSEVQERALGMIKSRLE
ncbi:hypothetical protein JYT72_03315, partial [Crocinitomix catalasitica]|nr:hypothetical protein [Crocinitomix catalasitica]